MIVELTKVCVVVLMILEPLQAANKTKCEVVQALRAENVPDKDFRNWLCLVDKESSYEYDLEKYNDVGIFQLNRNIWCNNPRGYGGTTCWMLKSYGCNDSCDKFLDSDISNDVHCAVRMRNCDGFWIWYAWRDGCADSLNSTEYDYDEC